MKIYNEVVSQFDELTGQWETISEDSFNYGGQIALAQGLPPNSTPIATSDTIADTIKTTAGYFTGGDGTLSGTDIFTGSLSDSNQKYYYNINNKNDETDTTSVTQLSVAFGHIAGSGSNQYGDTNNDPKAIIGESQAVYKQYANILLNPVEAPDGFKISAQGSTAKASTRDDYIYILNGKRNLYKDRLNKKALNIELSGSSTTGLANGGNNITLRLTDDSKTIPATATPAGPRFNIVSGTLGTVQRPATEKTYGWFYPERGVMIFSGAELSASIPGQNSFETTPSFTELTASINTTDADGGGFLISGAMGVHDFTASLSEGNVIQLISESADANGNIYHKAAITSITSDPMVITINPAWTTTDPVIDGSTDASGSIHLKLFKAVHLISNMTSSFDSTNDGLSSRYSSSGFAPNLDAHGDSKNALRLVNCLRNVGSNNAIQFRSEEDVTQESYFCRIKSSDYNFSNNPTFVSGGLNKIRNITMHGNTTTFITGVGLYNSSGQLLAIASLSKPLLKNFVSEATIKVQLTY